MGRYCTTLDTLRFRKGITCDVLSFYEKEGHDQPSREEILSRGHADNASMDEVAFFCFLRNADKVPLKWWNCAFIFPDAYYPHTGEVRCVFRDQYFVLHDVWIRVFEQRWHNYVLIRLTLPEKSRRKKHHVPMEESYD